MTGKCKTRSKKSYNDLKTRFSIVQVWSRMGLDVWAFPSALEGCLKTPGKPLEPLRKVPYPPTGPGPHPILWVQLFLLLWGI